MYKKIGLLIILVAGLVVYLRPKSVIDCRERAFQSSELFGEAPRRYFEIFDLNSGAEASFFGSYSYLISMNCSALLVLKVSPFACLTVNSRKPLESEKNDFKKFLKNCEEVN